MRGEASTISGYSITLDLGRKVFMGRCEDDWVLVFTNTALETPETRLRLTDAAMDAVVRLHRKHTAPELPMSADVLWRIMLAMDGPRAKSWKPKWWPA